MQFFVGQSACALAQQGHVAFAFYESSALTVFTCLQKHRGLSCGDVPNILIASHNTDVFRKDNRRDSDIVSRAWIAMFRKKYIVSKMRCALVLKYLHYYEIYRRTVVLFSQIFFVNSLHFYEGVPCEMLHRYSVCLHQYGILLHTTAKRIDS